MEVTKKQSTPNFPKNEHFLPADMHTYVCASGGKKCSYFGKLGVLCFLVFKICPFALLPTNFCAQVERGTKFAHAELGTNLDVTPMNILLVMKLFNTLTYFRAMFNFYTP